MEKKKIEKPIKETKIEYVSKATTTEITFESGITLPIDSRYYKVSLKETISLPNDKEVDVDKERQLLIDKVNSVVDNEALEIIRINTPKK